MITIRSEKPEDFDTIYEINKKVFNGPVFKVFAHLMTLSRGVNRVLKYNITKQKR